MKTRIYRLLFWMLAVIGRPFGGIPPRRIVHWLAVKGYGGNRPGQNDSWWIRDRDNVEFLLHPHYVTDVDVIAFGSYEPGVQKYINAALKPGMVCLDIGANCGLVGLHMARKVGPHGKVYAFEPVPHVFGKLKANVQRNRLDAVMEPRLCAISSTSGTALMNVPDEEQRNQGLGLLVPAGTHARKAELKVECSSLDDFVAHEGLTHVDFVKIDVQGAESLVLQGGKASLERFGPEIVTELSEGLSPLGKSSRETIRQLEDGGYEVFELTGKGKIGRRLVSAAIRPGFAASAVLCRKPT